MLKKIILFFVFFILIAFSSCKSIQSWKNKKPEAKVEQVLIKSLSFEDLTLLLKLSIKNPYPVGINIERIEVQTLVEGKQLFKTVTPDKFEIKKAGTKQNDLTINLDYDDLRSTASNYYNKDYLDVEIKTRVDIRLPDLPGLPEIWEIPITVEKKLPTIKPVITIKNFDIDLPSKNEIQLALNRVDKNPVTKNLVLVRIMAVIAGKNDSKGVEKIKELDLKFGVKFDIEVKNLAKTRLHFQQLDYNVKLNGINFMTGLSDNVVNQGQISNIRINNVFSASQLNSSLIKALVSKRKRLEINGIVVVLLPEEISEKPFKVDFVKSGNV